MELVNATTVQEFVLLGFNAGRQARLLLLALFTAIYTLTLAENFLIVMVVVQDSHLARIPMYILLSNFSFLEMCYVTSTVPRMLLDLSFAHGVISIRACFVQLYVFFSLGCTECYFLSAMALDRYLAICYPLQYTIIMSPDACCALVAVCWIIGFVVYVVPVLLLSRLSFCGPNSIDHFLCDPGPILALACPPRGNLATVFNVIVSSGLLATLFFIVASYGFVGITLVKASSQSSRGKGFSTVSSHLAVVTLFFGSVAAMYAVPNGESHATVTKVVTLFYTSVTPLFNPLIYCLRNNQVKDAMARLLKKKSRGMVGEGAGT